MKKLFLLFFACMGLNLLAQRELEYAKLGTALAQVAGVGLVGYSLYDIYKASFDSASNELSNDLVKRYEKYLDQHKPNIYSADRYIRVNYFKFNEFYRQVRLEVFLLSLGIGLYATGKLGNL